jgi:hypothetical protein
MRRRNGCLAITAMLGKGTANWGILSAAGARLRFPDGMAGNRILEIWDHSTGRATARSRTTRSSPARRAFFPSSGAEVERKQLMIAHPSRDEQNPGSVRNAPGAWLPQRGTSPGRAYGPFVLWMPQLFVEYGFWAPAKGPRCTTSLSESR